MSDTTDKWISAKDRPPEIIQGTYVSENVFVIINDKVEVMCLYKVEDGFLWANCYGNITGDGQLDDEYLPTLWMPLPEPPKTNLQ